MVTIRRIVGDSMRPTFSPGTIVLGLRFIRPRVGNIVVAEYDGREIIKRVAHIGSEGVYVLGDNADQSTDSRSYGWLAPQTIKSVIVGSIKR